MKKTLIFILMLSSIVCCCLTSCNSENKSSTDTTVSTVHVPPLDFATFHFDSYNDLAEWLTKEDNIERDNIDYGITYSECIRNVKKTPSLINIPYVGENAMELRDKPGFSGITFMTSELYGIPWIWYFGNIEGNEVIVKQALLPDSYLSVIKDKTAPEAIKAISPNAPNVDNVTSNYKQIIEKEITVSGEKISSVYYEVEDREQVFVEFVYNGTIIIITARTKDVLREIFMSGFSLKNIRAL